MLTNHSAHGSLIPDIRCRYCNHTLVDRKHRFHGLPTVRVTVSAGMEHGWFRFSAFPGVKKFRSEIPITRAGDANFFCPHCHTEFAEAETCKECGAPMVPMINHRGIQTMTCSWVGCGWTLPEPVSETEECLVG